MKSAIKIKKENSTFSSQLLAGKGKGLFETCSKVGLRSRSQLDNARVCVLLKDVCEIGDHLCSVFCEILLYINFFCKGDVWL